MPTAMLNAVSLYVSICQRGYQVQSKLMSREYFPRTLGVTMILSAFAGYSCMRMVQESNHLRQQKLVLSQRQSLDIGHGPLVSRSAVASELSSSQTSEFVIFDDRVPTASFSTQGLTQSHKLRRYSTRPTTTVRTFLSRHQESRKQLF